MRTAACILIGSFWFCLATAGFGQHSSDGPDKDAPVQAGLPKGALQRLGTAHLRLGHTLLSALLTPDGKHAAVVTHLHGVLWVDLSSGRVVHRKVEYPPYSAENGIALSPDGKVLASLSPKRFIELWDVTEKKALHVLEAKHLPKSIAFSFDGRMIAVGEAAGTDGDDVSLWDVRGGKLIRTFHVDQGLSARATFSPNGDLLATWGFNHPYGKKDPNLQKVVQIWNIRTGQEARRITVDGERTEAVAFSPNEKHLAVMTYKGGLEIRDVAGKLVKQLQPQLGFIRWLHFSPDGHYLVALDRAGPVQLWETASWQSRTIAGGPHWRITSVAFLGKQVLACGPAGQTLQVQDLIDPPARASHQEHRHVVSALQFLSNRSLLSADAAGQVFLWERDSGKPLGGWNLGDQIPKGTSPEGQFSRSAFSPQGKYLVAHDAVSQQVHVWNLAQKRKVWSMPGPRNGHEAALAFTRDHQLAIMTKDPKNAKDPETLVVWDIDRQQEVRKLKLPPAPTVLRRFGFAHAAFSPDGQLLAAAVQHNQLGKVGTEVFIWDLKTGYEKRHLMQETSYTPVLCFSPDGSLLALGGPKDGIALVHVWTGKLDRLEAVDRSLDAIAFSPDGRTIAGATYYNQDDVASLYLWERLTGSLRCRYQGHVGKIHALAYSPSGGVLASAGVDGPILLWDMTGKLAFGAKKTDPKQLWANLGQPKGSDAFAAMGQLASDPDAAIVFLRQRLLTDKGKAIGVEQIRKWIRDLDNELFKVREQASTALKDQGERALAELHMVMKTDISLESRLRIEQIMEAIQGTKSAPRDLAERRSVELLEHLRTDASRQFLKDLASGTAGVSLTDEAQAALRRIQQSK